MLSQQLDCFEEQPPSWSDEDMLRLCEALVLGALEDVLRPRGRGRSGAQFQSTLAWIGTDSRTPFSFRFCCEICGYDADRMRTALSLRLIAFGIDRNDLKKMGWF